MKGERGTTGVPCIHPAALLDCEGGWYPFGSLSKGSYVVAFWVCFRFLAGN